MPYDIQTITSGSSSVLYTFNGHGTGRLFESGIGDLYIHGLIGTLLVSRDGAASFTEILPNAVSAVSGMCQSGTQSTTLIFHPKTVLGFEGYYQNAPETSVGWTLDGESVLSFNVADAIADDLSTGNILIGNRQVTSSVKILRNAGTSPYTSWVESDAGLPQSGVNSEITDLEMAQ